LPLKDSEGYYLSALMNEIVRMLPDDPENNKKRFKKIKNALWKIQVGYETKYLRKKDILPLSIDSFVSTQMDDMHFDDTDKNIIKYCIYYLIKGYEYAKTGQQGFERTWIYDLASIVSEFKANEIIDNLSIVTFNYDRVFEHYFCDYLLHNDVFDETSKKKFLNNVHHVYGSLGNLSNVRFGLPNDQSTITEQFYKNIELIREPPPNLLCIDQAETFNKVHFIGFGYDDTNLKALTLEQFTSASFYGTAYNFSANQRVKIEDKIPGGIELHDLSCSKYINSQRF
jgi:hypothetical protein